MRKTLNKTFATLAFAGVLATFSPALQAENLPQNTLPNQGVVIAGQAQITQTAPNHLLVTQSTDKAILNWHEFNLSADSYAHFAQPNRDSITLNRVTGTTAPSFIDGHLSATGQFWLINPAGTVFGEDSQLDVAGLLASTADIADPDFLAERYHFTQPGQPNATIRNHGQISIRDSGLAAFVAPSVQNNGTIRARLGKIGIGAAETFTLDPYGDNLITLGLDSQAAGELIGQHGTVSANGGTVEIKAATLNRLVDNAINMTGLIEAQTVSQSADGTILLDGGAGGDVNISGTITADGEAGQKGSTILATGKHLNLTNTARITANGDTGGGNIYLGGDVFGGRVLPDSLAALLPEPSPAKGLRLADTTTLATDVAIQANARLNGNGGTVILWGSDSARLHGSVSAHGGLISGNGGFIEHSGKGLVTRSPGLDLSAPNGKAGTELFDPLNLTFATDAVYDALLIKYNEGDIQYGYEYGGTSYNLFIKSSSLANATQSMMFAADYNLKVNGAITLPNLNGGNLTLIGNRIDINAPITAAGNLALTASTINIYSPITLTNGSLTTSNASLCACTTAITADGTTFGGGITATGTFTVTNGKVELKSPGNYNINWASVSGGDLYLQPTQYSNGEVYVRGGISVVGGSLYLGNLTSTIAFYNAPTLIASNDIVLTPRTLSQLNNNANVTLNAGRDIITAAQFHTYGNFNITAGRNIEMTTTFWNTSNVRLELRNSRLTAGNTITLTSTQTPQYNTQITSTDAILEANTVNINATNLSSGSGWLTLRTGGLELNPSAVLNLNLRLRKRDGNNYTSLGLGPNAGGGDLVFTNPDMAYKLLYTSGYNNWGARDLGLPSSMTLYLGDTIFSAWMDGGSDPRYTKIIANGNLTTPAGYHTWLRAKNVEINGRINAGTGFYIVTDNLTLGANHEIIVGTGTAWPNGFYLSPFSANKTVGIGQNAGADVNIPVEWLTATQTRAALSISSLPSHQSFTAAKIGNINTTGDLTFNGLAGKNTTITGNITTTGNLTIGAGNALIINPNSSLESGGNLTLTASAQSTLGESSAMNVGGTLTLNAPFTTPSGTEQTPATLSLTANGLQINKTLRTAPNSTLSLTTNSLDFGTTGEITSFGAGTTLNISPKSRELMIIGANSPAPENGTNMHLTKANLEKITGSFNKVRFHHAAGDINIANDLTFSNFANLTFETTGEHDINLKSGVDLINNGTITLKSDDEIILEDGSYLAASDILLGASGNKVQLGDLAQINATGNLSLDSNGILDLGFTSELKAGSMNIAAMSYVFKPWATATIAGVKKPVFEVNATTGKMIAISEPENPDFWHDGWENGFKPAVGFALKTGNTPQAVTATNILRYQDKSGTYFYGGAGLDGDYIPDMKSAFIEAGIDNVYIGNPEGWTSGLPVDITEGIIKYRDYSASNGFKYSDYNNPGGQFNLVGYSYGGTVVANIAAEIALRGGHVDNLVLIGAPISQTLKTALELTDGISNVHIINLAQHGDPIFAGISYTDFLLIAPLIIENMYLNPGEGHFYYSHAFIEGYHRRRALGTELYSFGLR